MDKAKYYSNIVRAFNGPRDVWVSPYVLQNKKPVTKFDHNFGTHFSCQYELPLELDSDKLWLLCMAYLKEPYAPKDKAKFKDVLYRMIYKPLAERYPEFKGLDDHYMDVLLGVASEYAPHDIQEYITDGGLQIRHPRYQEKLKHLEAKTKVNSLDFVPSIKTLVGMCRHFGVE